MFFKYCIMYFSSTLSTIILLNDGISPPPRESITYYGNHYTIHSHSNLHNIVKRYFSLQSIMHFELFQSHILCIQHFYLKISYNHQLPALPGWQSHHIHINILSTNPQTNPSHTHRPQSSP